MAMKGRRSDVELAVLCNSWQEAQRIADELFKRKMIDAADFVPLKLGDDHMDEQYSKIQLIMIAQAGKIGTIEMIVHEIQGDRRIRLHHLPSESYDQEQIRANELVK